MTDTTTDDVEEEEGRWVVELVEDGVTDEDVARHYVFARDGANVACISPDHGRIAGGVAIRAFAEAMSKACLVPAGVASVRLEAWDGRAVEKAPKPRRRIER